MQEKSIKIFDSLTYQLRQLLQFCLILHHEAPTTSQSRNFPKTHPMVTTIQTFLDPNPSNVIGIFPNSLSLLNNLNEDSINKQEKLMKVCVDHCRSTLHEEEKIKI